MAIVVASPALFHPRCKTPDHMRLASALSSLPKHRDARVGEGRLAACGGWFNLRTQDTVTLR